VCQNIECGQGSGEARPSANTERPAWAEVVGNPTDDRYTLNTLLRGSYRKTYIDQATREDVLKFIADCYGLGLGHRTVYDKLVVVLQLFKRFGKTG
jgi:hypothetical protein